MLVFLLRIYLRQRFLAPSASQTGSELESRAFLKVVNGICLRECDGATGRVVDSKRKDCTQKEPVKKERVRVAYPGQEWGKAVIVEGHCEGRKEKA